MPVEEIMTIIIISSFIYSKQQNRKRKQASLSIKEWYICILQYRKAVSSTYI